MKALEVTRRTPGDIGTQGRAVLVGTDWSCDTLELPWKNNLRGESCILPGTYKAWRWFSPTFGLTVLRLEDKNGRQDCLWHPGNLAGDTTQGRVTEVHGCTLPGKGFGMILLPKGNVRQWGIQNSKNTLADLLRQLGTGELSITYKWAPGCEPEDPSNHLLKS